MTWEEFKKIVDESLDAIGENENIEIGYIDVSNPTDENVAVHVNDKFRELNVC